MVVRRWKMMYLLTEKERAIILEALEFYKDALDGRDVGGTLEDPDKLAIVQKLIANKINA